MEPPLDASTIITVTSEMLIQQIVMWQPDHPLYAVIAPPAIFIILFGVLGVIVRWIRSCSDDL